MRGTRDSPFNDLLSARRTFAFESFELARVKRIAKAQGVTINDLFVAAVAMV